MFNSWKTSTPHMDASLYRSVVGSLQYLALTHLDATFSVNYLAQHVHAPTNDHFQALKWVLHYHSSTIQYGIHLKCSDSLQLHAYCDAD